MPSTSASDPRTRRPRQSVSALHILPWVEQAAPVPASLEFHIHKEARVGLTDGYALESITGLASPTACAPLCLQKQDVCAAFSANTVPDSPSPFLSCVMGTGCRRRTGA